LTFLRVNLQLFAFLAIKFGLFSIVKLRILNFLIAASGLLAFLADNLRLSTFNVCLNSPISLDDFGLLSKEQKKASSLESLWLTSSDV